MTKTLSFDRSQAPRTPFEWIDAVTLRLWTRYCGAPDPETRDIAGSAYVLAADCRDLVVDEMETAEAFARQCARCAGQNGFHDVNCEEVNKCAQ